MNPWPALKEFKQLHPTHDVETELLIQRALLGLERAFPSGKVSVIDQFVALNIEAEKLLKERQVL